MVPRLTHERHSRRQDNAEREEAWHLVAVLLCIGRPAIFEEIVSKCGLFVASPQYVRYLCSIPNSPLCLVNDRTVSVSAAVVWAFKEFASKLIEVCVPRSIIRFTRMTNVSDGGVKTYVPKRKAAELDSLVFPVAKRRLFLPDGEKACALSFFSCRTQERLPEESVGILNAQGIPAFNLPVTERYSGNLTRESAAAPLYLDLLHETSHFALADYKHGTGTILGQIPRLRPTLGSWDGLFNFTLRRFDNPALCMEAGSGGSKFSLTYHDEAVENGTIVTKAGDDDACVHNVSVNQSIDNDEANAEVKEKAGLPESSKLEDPGNCVTLEHHSRDIIVDDSLPGSSSPQGRTLRSSRKGEYVQDKSLAGKSLAIDRSVHSLKQKRQCKEVKRLIFSKPKSKQKQSVQAEENAVDSPQSQVDQKNLPQFESFLVEDEEGSGGYGTVYRARSKDDGKRCAIKCPHENAHKHHVNNEKKMLERFGGRNFIINYRGSFRFGNADCFVLEYVKHDRPEILKREIVMFQLQWYGYCMFKALAHLHKHGVVHRDVKPGNFLFSRKLMKGFLIDFNLAMDLQQKYPIGSKTETKVSSSFDHVPLPHWTSVGMTKGKNLLRSKTFAARVDSQPILEPKKMKKATVSSLKAYHGVGGRNVFGSQGGDGSGITSTKDATSTRTPSAERLQGPIPCLGRKELINFVQGVMRSPGYDSISILDSQRKRVSAPPSMINKMLYPTPMPLRSGGFAVSGDSLMKSKGDGKQKKNGTCVGTKGFRAPEVLFRSSHQGFKVDVWSAGVTLLYLTLGRIPFSGEPEQNIKEIAKLRGSEDLWELAKLHDCESSFPQELYDIGSLPSMKLKEWWKLNTKRCDFLELIPASLFDLVEKCLAVNPRLRITAEEALKHEFFAPCRDSLNKQRLSQDKSLAALTE